MLLWGELCPPKTKMRKSSTPVLQNVTSFGSNGIAVSGIRRVGPYSSMGVLGSGTWGGGRKHMNMQGETE